MDINEFILDLQAVLDKVKSIAKIKNDIKIIEAKLPKIKLQGTLNSTATKKELNSKLKSINSKVKIDADVTVADKKIKKLGQQKASPTITPKVDNSQVVSDLKQAQKETKTLWERFTNGIMGINLIRMGIQEVTRAIRQAITEIKELDTIKTNIQMVSGASDSGVNAMMSSYNKMAKDLSSTTKEVGEAANEFLRMGESIASTNELIKSSQVLSKVGMIESADSASYLISSLKGYKIAAENSMDVVSKLTSVDLKAAVSAGGLAEALSKCSNIANNSGIAMDRLIGYTATVGEVTQKNMSEVGNSFQSLLSRMNNIKIGKFIDDETGESLSDTEAVLNKLGIKLRDTEDSYRSFDDVLDDVGSRWKDFTKVEQNAISVAIAGTRQRENFEALMNNWGNALKYSETAANSAGSALERYGVYQDSIQAKTNELTAAIESLSTNIISEDLYSGIIEATTNVVEFIDKTKVLKGTLAGLVTMGISKAFVSMATGIIAASKSTAQLTTAMALFDKGRSIQNLKDIGAACKGLSDQQLKLVLSTKGLISEDRKAILTGMGLKKTEQEQTLATLGFANAENVATASTFSFKGALNSLMTAISMNPIGALATAVSAVTIAFSVYKQHQEETRQKTEEATSAYKESASAIDDYASRYQELHKALLKAEGDEQETYSIKKQLLDLQTELNDKYGDEHGAVNLVTDAYKNQIEAIKALNKEKAQTFLNENKEGIDKASKEMTKDRHYNLSYTGISSYTDDGAALKEIAEKYKEQGIYLLDELGNGNYAQFSIHLNTNVQSAYDTINKFENDVRAKAKELGDEHIFDDVLEISSSELNNAKEIIDSYADTFKQALTAEIASDDSKSKIYSDALLAVEAYNEAVLNSKNPYDDQNVIRAKENLDTIKSSVQENEEEFEKYSILFDNVFDQADTRLIEFYEAVKNDSGLQELAKDLEGLSDIDLKVLDENVGDNESFDKLKASAKEYKVNVDELIDTLIRLGYAQGEVKNSASNIAVPDFSEKLTTSQESLDKFQSSVKTAADAYSTLLSGNYSSSDLLDSIQAINKAVSDMGGSLNWEFINNNKDSINLLGDAIEHISQKYAESILSGAGIDVDSDFGQMLANNIIQAQKASTQLDVLNDQIDSLQAAYNNLTDIVGTYNETGYITFDQLQTLLEMEPQYLSCLVDENGQLQLNEAAMTEFANKRLDDAEAQAIQQAITELGQIALQDEKTAVNENAQAFSNAVNDLAGYNAELANTIAEATVGASAIRDLNAAINGAESQGATDDQINTVLNNLETKLQLIGNVRDKVAAGGLGSVVKSGSKSGSSKDKHKEAYEKELKELEHMHEMGLISDEEYWQARLDLNEKYFGESSGMHQKYLDEYQKNEEDILKGLKDLWKDYYSERKDNLKDLISYASKLYDKEIDSLESSIKVIEKKRDAEKKHWQDQIDALKDANKERERAIDLQEKQWALQKAMHQRTILLYSENLGMHYVNDSKAERSAKNDLDDAENDNKIAELEKQLDTILKVYDSQIESINQQIDRLKEVKSAWSEIVDNQELKELEERLKSIFGGDVKDKILSGNTDFINSIVSQYSDTSDMLRTIEDATLADIQNMVAQYGVLPENLMPIADAAADINNALGTVDTTDFNTNLDNTAQSSSNAAEKVQNVTNALNTLSNDISSYQMPAINTDNFTSAFTEEGGILSALNGFMERYKEICDGIPEIWNNSLAEAFGHGGGNGDPLAGGLPNDTKYDTLFAPLLTALNNCKTNMEDKLKECLGTFKTFQTDLSGVIGVGGGSDSTGASISQSGAKGNSGKGSGGEKKSESGGGSDTIVGAIQEGGSLIDEALNGGEGWSASFNTAAGSIHETATYIVECIESMVETIVSACSAAIEAINLLASADENNSNNPTPAPYGRSGHGHGEIGNAYATGINATKKDEKNAIVSEYGQREMTVLPNGRTIITDEPTAMDLPKGTVVYNEEQTKKILNNKPDTSGIAYAKGTGDEGWWIGSDGHRYRDPQPGERAYELQKAFKPVLEQWKSGQLEIFSNAFFEHQKQMEKWTKEVTNNTAINNITNNRNVQQPVVHNHINVTLPNVTNSTSAESLLKDLQSLATKKMQVNW